MTPEELFEPIVIFFGLTNSPAMFQTMMNEILRNLINTGEVASFIDDIIVGTEEGGRYNIGLRQKNENGSGCIRLYNGRSIIYRV